MKKEISFNENGDGGPWSLVLKYFKINFYVCSQLFKFQKSDPNWQGSYFLSQIKFTFNSLETKNFQAILLMMSNLSIGVKS